MIRVFCTLLCLSVLPSCDTASAGKLLMMPVNLGKGLLNTAGRTLGRVVEADSRAPNAEVETMPKPHQRLTQPRTAESASKAASRVAMTTGEAPST